MFLECGVETRVGGSGCDGCVGRDRDRGEWL